MAQITLGSGESFTVSGGTNTISGTTGGGETVTINGGVNTFTADFNAGGDRVILAGSASQYTVERSGSSIVLRGPSGTVVTFPAPNPNLPDASNPRISFQNNGTPQDLVLDSTTAGVFTLTPTGGQAQTINTAPATVTTTQQPPVSQASVAVSVANGTEGGANITYTFTLSAAQTSPVTLNVATTGGTATVGSDYTPVSTTVTFAPGQTTQFLTVNVIDDTVIDSSVSETVILSITAPSGITAPATVQATITDNETAPVPTPQSFQLTTGSDTVPPTGVANPADDRISGVQSTTEPGKLLSQTDRVDGGTSTTNVSVTTANGTQTFAGGDLLELFNAPNPGNANTVVPNVLDDVDLSQVRGVERLDSNYNQITLGAAAAASGITFISTIQSDTRGITVGGVAGNAQYTALQTLGNGNVLTQGNGQGALLDITSAFTSGLTAQLSNGSADLVRVNLDTARTGGAGLAINTGSSITTVAGAVISPVDQVVVTSAGSVRLSLVSGAAGNGVTTRIGNELAINAQTETGGNATGVSNFFDDEGVEFTGVGGATFHVVDPFTDTDNDGQPNFTDRGSGFATAFFGTNGVDIYSGTGAKAYINAGAGNDQLTGTTGDDVLVGGGDNDILIGQGGIDTLLGGGGNDVLNGGAGIDSLQGGAGSDVYVYADGEFVTGEAIVEAAGGADTDYIAVSQATDLGDAGFAGRNNIEGLATNITDVGVGSTNTVTLGSEAARAGIRTVVAGNDNVVVTAAFNAGLTAVYTTGNVNIGSGAFVDAVALQGTNPLASFGAINGFTTQPTSASANGAYAGTVILGDGNDTLYAGYALQNGVGVTTASTLTGGAGDDTLVIGGLAGGFGGTSTAGNSVYTLTFGAMFTEFERLRITQATAGASTSYNITLNAANVANNSVFFVDAQALRDPVTNLNAETLIFSAAALTAANGKTAARVDVTGGFAGDNITGGEFDDRLAGGAGNDALIGGAGIDTLLGEAGTDTLTGGAGNDIMDGGELGDTYVFATGEFLGGDTINDTGNTGVDTIDVTSAIVIQDAFFTTVRGVEALTTNVAGTQNDATDVFVGANARAAGIVTVNAGNDDVSAAGYGADGLTINIGQSAIGSNAGNVIGSENGETVVINPLTDYAAAGSIVLNGGNDTLRSGFTLSDQSNSAATTATLNGGAGTDVIEIGGSGAAAGLAAGFNTPVVFNFITGAGASNLVGFETLNILGSDVGTTAAPGTAPDFDLRLGGVLNAAGVFTINASALTGTIAGIAAPNNTQNLTLTAGTVTTAIDVTGGANDDVLTTGSASDFLRGGAGNDTLTGGAGFDDYQGGDGDDTIVLSVLEFNSDNDRIDGGEGAETAAGDTLLIRGTQNLAAGGATQDIADVGFSTRIVANSIEQITLEGIVGGNTAFNYQAGFFSQSAGVNVINVGARANGSFVSVANYTSGGPTNLPVPAVTLNDLVDPANNTTFTGSIFVDTFNLGALVNGAIAGGGNDVVRAGAGNDVINFGTTLTTADVVDGSAGVDVLNVGLAVAGYAGQTVTLTSTAAGDGTVATGIRGVETVNLAAGIVAVAGGPAATTNTYNVQVNDTAYDAANGQTLITIGAAGLASTEALTVNASNAAVNGLAAAGAGVTGPRTITVNSGAGADFLTGGTGNDTLNGGGGIDNLSGGDGNDTLNGDAGADIILGGIGVDTITGGADGDTITGGFGNDVIILGTAPGVGDGARDTVNIQSATVVVAGVATLQPESDRAPLDSRYESVSGFEVGASAAAVTGGAGDVINFGSGIITENSASITNGVVQTGSILQSAINTAGSVLAAIQLVEQEFQSDGATNNGVVAFRYTGADGVVRTFIGEVTGVQGQEAFTDIVELTGLAGSGGAFTQLVDVDGNAATFGLGLSL